MVGAVARQGARGGGGLGERSRRTPLIMRILITGANGQLGRDLQDALAGQVPAGGRRCDLLGPEGPRPSVAPRRAGHRRRHPPGRGSRRRPLRVRVVPPRSGAPRWRLTAVDACESDPDRAFAVNALGTRNVAEAAAKSGPPGVRLDRLRVRRHGSDRPYVEWDTPNPLSVYGGSKLGGERECPPGTTVVRTSLGLRLPRRQHGQARPAVGRRGRRLRFVDDQHGSPTFTADLAAAIVTLAWDRRPATST